MEIAVLGGGHGCYAAAADLSQKGHRVRFWRRNLEAFEPVLRSGGVNLIDHKGERSVPIHLVTNVLSEAVKDAQIIVVPLPAFSHEICFITWPLCSSMVRLFICLQGPSAPIF